MRIVAVSDWPLRRVAAAGLVLLLLLLPFHLLIKRALPDPVGTYWKDLLIAASLGLVGLALLRRRIGERPPASRRRPDAVTLFVLVFLSLLLLRGLTSPDLAQAGWGLYLGASFLPVYFLVVWVLAADGRATRAGSPATATSFAEQTLGWLCLGLVVVGCIVGLGGAIEFLTDQTLVPSEEIFERSGFYAVYVFGTSIRRVYFTFDAPTALGHYLTLILPIGAALLAFPLAATRWDGADRQDPGLDRSAGGHDSAPGSSGRVWPVRIALGLALLVMAFGLTVTFSRAAWAGALAGLCLLLAGGLWLRDRRFVVAATVGLGLFALGWGLASWAVAGRDQTRRLSVELSAAQFAQIESGEAPQIATGRISEIALTGPGAGDPGPVGGSASQWTIGGETRTVYTSEPAPDAPGEISYRWEEFPAGSFVFSVALDPDYWRPDLGDGVRLAGLAESGQATEQVFARHLNPKANPADQKWRSFEIDLSRYQGRPLTLRLRVHPESDSRYDRVGWSRPRLYSEPFFAGKDDPALRAIAADQLRSYGDLGEDSNRDRLAAWLRSKDLWLEAPLWGHGLGTTGAATFRVPGGQGFVTESQPLKVLVEMGLIGLVSYLAIFPAAAWRVGQTLRAPTPAGRRTFVLGIAAALGAVFVDGLVLQNLEIKQVQLTFWTLLAALVVFTRTPGPASTADVRSERSVDLPAVTPARVPASVE
ncbi:MAG TPA: hypothetical protein VHL09_13995 [Dehalococcoidia bacterium]|nr:hypothetical protein [Dehalococcoidia bacterium]